MRTEELVRLAFEARARSYCPYSHFAVGAALLCADGRVFTGCNIENASYSMTVCAERTAFFSAVAQGERTFTAIAIAGGPQGSDAADDYVAPCGACRQVMAEFCAPAAFRVTVCRSAQDYKTVPLGELLPLSFGAKDLD